MPAVTMAVTWARRRVAIIINIMYKIICIGECGISVTFDAAQPQGAGIDGRIARAAMLMGGKGLAVSMASEASSDAVGDMIVNALTAAGVDVAAVDRFYQGHSPLTIYAKGESCRYEAYGDGGFDIVWPRVDDSTIVIFGEYYCLDPRMRARIVAFLANCVDHKALLMYVPGFPTRFEGRMTRVMPAVIENLEWAHIVVATTDDLAQVFNESDAATCYTNHIAYYGCSLVAVSPQGLSMHCGNSPATAISASGDPESRIAEVIAGTAEALTRCNVNADNCEALLPAIQSSILSNLG